MDNQQSMNQDSMWFLETGLSSNLGFFISKTWIILEKLFLMLQFFLYKMEILLPTSEVYRDICELMHVKLFFFFWLYLPHVEVLRPGNESVLQLWSASQLRQCWILYTLCNKKTSYNNLNMEFVLSRGNIDIALPILF